METGITDLEMAVITADTTETALTTAEAGAADSTKTELTTAETAAAAAIINCGKLNKEPG